MDDLAFSKALQSIWETISAGNKYIDDTAPWTLAKSPDKQARLATVMYHLLESQRLVYCLLSSFMPQTAVKGLAYLGCPEQPTADSLRWGILAPGTSVAKAEALFPRIDDKNGE
jgi:methionyl-tRNA synthetase